MTHFYVKECMHHDFNTYRRFVRLLCALCGFMVEQVWRSIVDQAKAHAFCTVQTAVQNRFQVPLNPTVGLLGYPQKDMKQTPLSKKKKVFPISYQHLLYLYCFIHIIQLIGLKH